MLVSSFKDIADSVTVLPAGQPRHKSSSLMGKISARWKAMSPSEQIAVTDHLLQALKDQKEMQTLSLQNVPINAFHDACTNIAIIKSEVSHVFLVYLALLLISASAFGSPCSYQAGVCVVHSMKLF